MRNRAQLFTWDTIISLSIFMFILMSILSVGITLNIKVSEVSKKRYMHEKAFDIADVLLRTPGSPPNWYRLASIDATTVNCLGLASEDNVLDKYKLDKFKELTEPTATCDDVRKMLGVGAFTIEIEDMNSPPLSIYSFKCITGLTGETITTDETIIVERYALLDDKTLDDKKRVKFILTLWV